MEDLVEPTLLQIREEEEEMLQIKEEEEEMVQIKEEEEEMVQIKEEEEEMVQIKEEEEEMLQIKEEEEEMLQIKEEEESWEEEEAQEIKEEEESWEEEEAREIKEEEEELCIKQEGSDDEGSGSSRDLIRNQSAEAAGDPAALPANQASAGPAPARQNRPAAAGGLTRTRAPLWNTSKASRSVRKRKRARKLHRRLLLVNGLISESLLLLGETPGRRSARRRNAVLHLDSFDKTKAALLLHATQTVLHSISCDLNVISRGSCDSTC